jgi:two-component system response regulator (stage 0 sporulation protein F)
MAKILVVDDEEHIRFLYAEELTDEGYDVVTAESGYLLLERIEEERPDLVVLDIKMVDYDGLDLLQDVRNRFYNLPVVLCTAYDTFKEDLKSIAADFYVIKSSDLTELKIKIVMALQTGLECGRNSELPGERVIQNKAHS